MLEGAAEEAGPGDLELLPHAVLGDDPALLLPGDVRHVPGDRETPFEIAVLPVCAHDPRVHELEQAILYLDHGHVQRLAKLGRGEADAWGVAHRVGQVVDQPMQELVEACLLYTSPSPRD